LCPRLQIPSSFSIRLVDGPDGADWSSRNRRLLNTEKIIFKAEGSNPVSVDHSSVVNHWAEFAACLQNLNGIP
jgi:hypothetical protein